jgi:hypothetical protein
MERATHALVPRVALQPSVSLDSATLMLFFGGVD